jgi:signal transduction histidine kinase
MRQMRFSTFENIMSYDNQSKLMTFLVSGGLILLAAFYLLQFILHRRAEILAFAACCFMLAIRSQSFFISLLPSDYDWYFVNKFNFIGSICMVAVCILLIRMLYPHRINRRLVQVFLCIGGGFSVTALFSSVNFISGLGTPAMIIFIVTAIYLLVQAVRIFLTESMRGKLASFGIIALFVTLFFDVTLMRVLPFVTRNGVGSIGMLVFVLCYMLVLGMRAEENSVRLERTQAQAENLRLLNETKTEFLRNVTHELKTPLAVMKGYAQDTLAVLAETPPAFDDAAYNQRHIVNEADRLNRMVGQLLDAAAVESGRLSVNVQPISLAELVKHTVESYFGEANNANCQIKTELPKLPDIPADRERIGQVLLNLLSNAVRHTKDGMVTITLSATNNAHEVRITDIGEGMDTDVLGQVFKGYIERGGHNGMGLYICKKIIDAHGGEIHIESEKGKGTTVWFSLPGGSEA